MDISKKDGGVITRWTLNTLSVTPEMVNESVGVDVRTNECFVLSGYVKEDPTGRFEVGYHFRSSLVIDVDEEKGLVETLYTMYRLDGPAGEGLPDMGDMITQVFY